MRWHLWATVVAAYAAELRLETFVTVELTLDNLPLTLRAHVDGDPEKTAERFCKDAIPLSLECKELFAAALRVEQDAVRIRTGCVKMPEPRKQVPAPPKYPPRKEPAARAASKIVALSIDIDDGRRFQIEAGIDEAPHAAVAHLCREQDVKPRDCNVVALALAEKQKKTKQDGYAFDEYAAFMARSRMESREESWGDHLFVGTDDAAR